MGTSIDNTGSATGAGSSPSPGSARNGDWMQTFSGRRFWPLDPRPEEICIEDIAHGLSLTCRFSGQCAQFYSVAEHSVLCARNVSPDLRLVALLHDASEAYISDICRPAKHFIEGYKKIEASIMLAVGKRFGIAPAEWDEVKEIDSRMLATEAMQILAGGPRGWSWNPADHAIHGVVITGWSPQRAEEEFLEAFWQNSDYPKSVRVSDEATN